MTLGHDYPESLLPYAAVLDRFGPGSRRGGGKWYVRCNVHQDGTPSLCFWMGRSGQLMFGCWAGCAKGLILRVAGVSWRELFPARDEQRRRPGRVTARYDYRDEAGRLLYQVERVEWAAPDGSLRKRFRQRRPDGGGWVWKMEGVRRVLYRLPELLAAPMGRTVLVVGGEKDVETARELGFVATTNSGGETAPWLAEYSEALGGRNCVVIPDADETGISHAERVAGSLLIHEAATVAVASVPAKDLSAFVGRMRLDGLSVSRQRECVKAALEEAPQYRAVRRRGMERAG